MGEGLRRDLGLTAATSVVVGSMIGVGIFLGPRVIAQSLETPGLVMLAWLVGGGLVFTGALTMAELGARLPTSGGTYAYIRDAYGPLAGYLSGWSGFAVAKAASVSALAVAFSDFLPDILVALDYVPEGSTVSRLGQVSIAAFLIALVSVVNIVGVRIAGQVSVATMVVKVGALALLVVVGVATLGGQSATLFTQSTFAPPGQLPGSIFSAFLLALVPVFFAYDGWANSTQVAEEVRDPGRNVPRSLIIGVGSVVAVYALANLTYLLALGPENVGVTGAASQAASAIFGSIGGTLIVAAILVSILGTMNAVVLSGPRIAFAMARDGVFFPSIEKVGRFGTPTRAIIAQGIISLALVLVPPIGGRPLFDTLLTYVIVDSFIFYALGAAAIFVLRRRQGPDAAYTVPFYPWIPLIFIVGSGAFLINALFTATIDALAGIAIVLAGLPGYYYWRAKQATRPPTTVPNLD